MSKCDFNKFARKFIEITLRHGCSPVNLLHIFRTPLNNNTSERLFLWMSNQRFPKPVWQSGQFLRYHVISTKWIPQRCFSRNIQICNLRICANLHGGFTKTRLQFQSTYFLVGLPEHLINKVIAKAVWQYERFHEFRVALAKGFEESFFNQKKFPNKVEQKFTFIFKQSNTPTLNYFSITN